MNIEAKAKALFTIYAGECARSTGDPVGLRWEAITPYMRRAWIAVAEHVTRSR